jgi:hypothetical protein
MGRRPWGRGEQAILQILILRREAENLLELSLKLISRNSSWGLEVVKELCHNFSGFLDLV